MNFWKKRRGNAPISEREKKGRGWPGWNATLIVCNVVLVLGVIAAAFIYSRTVQNAKNGMKLDNFCNTVESLKQVSASYLSTEKGYVDDWAAYISSQHMTADEALDFIRATNTHEDRAAHLVDMRDLSARSTVLRNGNAWVHCYEDVLKQGAKTAQSFMLKMEQLFNAGQDEVLVLGKYRVGEIQRTVVSVGARVTIREADGSDRDYLLLRLIPVEYLQRTWVFPTEFPDAEISLIVSDGGYVVQSSSLRSSSFLEFIRGYNFQDNYNRVNTLAEQLRNNAAGLLQYKNSAGEECYFYYSRMGQDSDLCVLGYIPVRRLQTDSVDWSIVLLICGTLMVLMAVDGWYILSINRRLRQAVRTAEKANAAKTQFLSSMSHDIRTPMNAVIGMTEIATHHLDDPAFVKDCLGKVAVSGSHLLTLINDILDISKVESGKMTLNPCVFSLREAMEELCAMVRPGAEERDVAFELNMLDVRQDAVVGDPLRLRQVLINLLTNAVKYTEPGGHVTFEVSQQPLADAERVALRFVVSDDGVGMSEEFQKEMYDAFARETDSRVNRVQGSGLGLPIARQMMELMGGEIDCESAPGRGTRFTVTLEMRAGQARMAENAQLTADGENAEFAGLRALVAEDNDLNWEIIHILLGEHGVEADRAEDGRRCLERLNDPDAPKYDLVLMDVQMPEMDGREATRRMRASDRAYLRDLPVLAMTADAFAEDVYACMEAGMDGHVSKPVDMNQLIRYLKQVQSGTLRRKEENE